MASRCKVEISYDSQLQCETIIRLTDAVRATIPVGEEYEIKLDTSEAGEGRIMCRIERKVWNYVVIQPTDVYCDDGFTTVIYIPLHSGDYTLEIKFGGQIIPNGTFTQQVRSHSLSLTPSP